MSVEPSARGTSLWLMPEGRVLDEMTALIARLAERLGTESFLPHVTLLPGLEGPDGPLLEGARQLAGETRPVRLEPTEVAGTDAHFRCLFFRVSASGALQDAHARAARQFGREPDPSFDPHVSLVYGTLAHAAKSALENELASRTPPPFEGRRLHVWRTEGRVGEWREIAALRLRAD